MLVRYCRGSSGVLRSSGETYPRIIRTPIFDKPDCSPSPRKRTPPVLDNYPSRHPEEPLQCLARRHGIYRRGSAIWRAMYSALPEIRIDRASMRSLKLRQTKPKHASNYSGSFPRLAIFPVGRVFCKAEYIALQIAEPLR